MTCQNCGATHGCGCQQKTASDGKSCCSSCISTYETTLNKQRGQQNQLPVNNNIVGIQIQSITYQHNYQ